MIPGVRRALLGLAGAMALATTALTANAAWDAEQLGAATRIYLPESGGTPPLMIIVQGTATVGERERDWARWFAERSIAAVIIDSARLRGRRNFDGVSASQDYSHDIVEVLGWLAAERGIDTTRFGIIGFSRGGTTVLNAGKHFSPPTAAPDLVFSFYPGWAFSCPNTHANPATAIHVFYGDADEYGLDQDLQQACKTMTEKSANAHFHAITGAHHGFDQPGEGYFSSGRKSFRRKFDATARDDARRIVAEIIDTQWPARP
ncbi:dienelactone hydrolase family protein [Propionivibrio dicarboxylicus]|uniref:Dienelactone hydrolase n=1 Tax=Propionivibrio dicarboxylicus TaxID=83767 RepID=A0A1G8E268_9RHOO|nr:dienelactone hydrolase family protein [Propionivibrio dicarboxylicus]SDH63739.1 Dienelactone hydrolase [Propionivibrio dicarboxylicus]